MNLAELTGKFWAEVHAAQLKKKAKPVLSLSKGVPVNLSDALAVHPSQCVEAEAHAKKHGVPTQFERKYGRPIFVSRAHQKRYLKIVRLPNGSGVHNSDGGYGD